MKLFETITAAIKDFTEYGFDDLDRLERWVKAIRDAAVSSLVPEKSLEDVLKRTLDNIYKSQVEGGKLLRSHTGVARFTVDRLKPTLRAELDRRMAISRGLIKLNREQAIEQTVQRFSGWASSIPAGGSRAVEVKPVKDEIRKSFTSLPFKERRVIIDQGAKFVATLNDVIATDGEALAVIWHSRWRSPGYQFREDHKERDLKVYMIRGNWAIKEGLAKVGDMGYYDEITAVGEEVFCGCTAQYLYSLGDLPDQMLTLKGREDLAAAREKIKSMKRG